MDAYHGGPEGPRTVMGIADRLEKLVPPFGSPPEYQEVDAVSPGRSGIPGGEHAVWVEHEPLVFQQDGKTLAGVASPEWDPSLEVCG